MEIGSSNAPAARGIAPLVPYDTVVQREYHSTIGGTDVTAVQVPSASASIARPASRSQRECSSSCSIATTRRSPDPERRSRAGQGLETGEPLAAA